MAELIAYPAVLNVVGHYFLSALVSQQACLSQEHLSRHAELPTPCHGTVRLACTDCVQIGCMDKNIEDCYGPNFIQNRHAGSFVTR